MRTREGPGPNQAANGSWACESLPMSVRKELLARELHKLGFSPDAQAHGGACAQQQSGTGPRSQADADVERGQPHVG